MTASAESVQSNAMRTTLRVEKKDQLTPQPTVKENYFVTVLSISFVLGMAVSLAVYFAWRLHVVPPGLDHVFAAVALFVCPPFILSLAFGPIQDSDLALSLIVCTIIFANAFLYAGVAAGGYFVITTFAKRKHTS
jgi:hypothetical protein